MTVLKTQDTFPSISQRHYAVRSQIALDEEAEEMDSAARAVQPRNTDAFDYSSYHTIEEARNQIPEFKL